MTCDSDFRGETQYGQGARDPEIISRIVQARRRMAVIEGDDPDQGEPLPETIAGLQRFVDDDHPSAAHLRLQFWAEIEGHVDALTLRLDCFCKINSAVRRQALRVVKGRKP